jgi:hypothetical protein
MYKHCRRSFKAVLCFAITASFISLGGCSKTPVQKVLDSDPDVFAQAVNANFYVGGALFRRTECIHAVVEPSYINTLVNSDQYSNLKYPPDRVMKECGKLFSSLADELNKNSDFKGLTENDLAQKSVWEHYYQSSLAKFNFKAGHDE